MEQEGVNANEKVKPQEYVWQEKKDGVHMMKRKCFVDSRDLRVPLFKIRCNSPDIQSLRFSSALHPYCAICMN